MNDTRIGWLCLLLSVCISAAVTAQASHESGAYFSDAQPGLITGTYGSAPSTKPFRLEPGTSKAIHWGRGEDGPAAGEPIAQLDASGAMYLDFGRALQGHGDSRPDVFRLVSLAADAREVSFSVAGPISDFIVLVHLGDGAADVVPPGETSRVYMKIRVPDDAEGGRYTGTIRVAVEGWSEVVHLPLVIEVVEHAPKPKQHADPASGDVGMPDAPLSLETTATATPVDGAGPRPADAEQMPETEAAAETSGTATEESTSTLEPTATVEPTATLGVDAAQPFPAPQNHGGDE